MIANRYSLEREIGRGGMGSVWLGRDELLGRPVAIKRVGRAPGFEQDNETGLQRAEREARIAASLNHAHVVAVFDLIAEGDHQWLVMEYVEGRSLAQIVREDGPLSLEQAAIALADAAGALAMAHSEGVVHRDVKPSNILLTRLGEAKLLDFGIAKAQGDLTLTQSGMVSGSPAYLAPEVAAGQPATTASDVWSLGATLYHLLSGHPPYDVGDNIVGGLYRIVHQEPPRLDDAGWLAPLLAATMTRDPDQRWTMSRVAGYLAAGASGVEHGAAASQDPTPTKTALPPAPAVIPDGARDRPRRPGRAGRAGRRTLLVVAAVALVAALAFLLPRLLAGDEDPGPTAAPSPSASESPSPTESESPSASPSPSPTESSTSAAPTGPTARGMRSFVPDYLNTAYTDPPSGFAMLTPAFQQASGGLAGYEGFWGTVTEVNDVEVTEVDVEDLEVRYTYQYRTQGGTVRTEDVRLELSYDAQQDRYRIADEL